LIRKIGICQARRQFKVQRGGVITQPDAKNVDTAGWYQRSSHQNHPSPDRFYIQSAAM
jgi:hypothetical protein